MITGGKSYVSSQPAFSNDAKWLLVCSGNTVSVFSTSTGLQTSELEGHGALVTSVIVVPASTPANKLLCYCWTASLDGTIKYWDFAAPELMKTIDIRFPVHSMVIPGLLNERTESSEMLPDLFAYVYTEGAEEKEQPDSSSAQIRKCNLTKFRLVGGATLAETKKPGIITNSPSGKYIGIYEKRKLRIWEIPVKDSDRVAYKKFTLHHTKSISALAFHPTERMVAAGDVTGRILLWRDVGCMTISNGNKFINRALSKEAEERPGVRGNDDADSCTTWHWHSAQVNLLFFSSDGAYLYSGGKEGVLVVWQMDTGKKNFLPRIGSPLLYFINSPDPSLSAVSCADNRINLLRMPSMEILRSISGIKLPHSSLEIYNGISLGVVFNRSAGLVAVPTENYRVQLYSLFDDREISEVQICERNHQPGEEITVIVNMVALSTDGSIMSTVETRIDEEGIGSLVSLKFWDCDSENKVFNLSTVIYEPHRDAGVSCIDFHPRGHMVVSSSYGGDFKVWVRRNEVPPKDNRFQKAGWTCHAVGSYKKKAMTAAAFSTDGSVLAVAAEKVITLWDPERNTLVAVIGDCLEPIGNLAFVGKSDYLVSASRGPNPQLSVWSMSNLRLYWSYRLHAEAVACSLDNSTFAVLALFNSSKGIEPPKTALQGKNGLVLLFNADNPVPLSTWMVTKAQGGRLSFMQSNFSETVTSNEVLAYVNDAHEYVLMDPSGEETSKLTISRQRNFCSLEETERFGYASIYGELPEFSLEKDQQTAVSTITSETTWKSIFSGPSHRLPPLLKLCSEFLESLLVRRAAAVE